MTKQNSVNDKVQIAAAELSDNELNEVIGGSRSAPAPHISEIVVTKKFDKASPYPF
jgi:bacteriocin-like protein